MSLPVRLTFCLASLYAVVHVARTVAGMYQGIVERMML